jgi:hypothetical protein
LTTFTSSSGFLARLGVETPLRGGLCFAVPTFCYATVNLQRLMEKNAVLQSDRHLAYLYHR